MIVKLKNLLLEIDIEKHLQSRDVDLDKTYVIMDKKNGVATFLLYNLSGQLVGYQEYNPTLAKTRSNVGRYITYVTGKRKERMIAVWGTETIVKGRNYLFMVEGIFDAIKIHNAGQPAIAVLANNPKVLKAWIKALQKKIIVIADDDSAGRKLIKFGNKWSFVPEPYKDLGDMTQAEATKFINSLV